MWRGLYCRFEHFIFGVKLGSMHFIYIRALVLGYSDYSNCLGTLILSLFWMTGSSVWFCSQYNGTNCCNFLDLQWLYVPQCMPLFRAIVTLANCFQLIPLLSNTSLYSHEEALQFLSFLASSKFVWNILLLYLYWDSINTQKLHPLVAKCRVFSLV